MGCAVGGGGSLKRRGYDEFMAGEIAIAEFGKHLAQEWASLPIMAATKGAHRQITRGQSSLIVLLGP